VVGRNVNRRQGTGAIEHGQVAGVPSIGFDAIARTSRDEGGGNDVARNTVG
jgi:hypothetical protein